MSIKIRSVGEQPHVNPDDVPENTWVYHVTKEEYGDSIAEMGLLPKSFFEEGGRSLVYLANWEDACHRVGHKGAMVFSTSN